MKIENGTTLNQYKILSPIGKGGMGEVFLAQDTRLDRKVALKILPPEFADDKDRMARFVREAKSVSALNHPNIITIHEIGEQNGTHFITTEFIDGLTLGDYAKSKSLDYKTVLEIAVQVMSALDEAHSAGIIHRDIKPDNIMVRSNGLVKVLDFGIAKFAAPTEAGEEIATAIKTPTKAGMIIGTPKFMSPEQARGKDVDHQTDIFSFGVVLYDMLSGASPFSGETASDVLAAVLTKEPEQLRGVPAALEQLVSKTLQKDKRQRYQTAKELLHDLKEIKQELEIQSHLEGTSSPNRDEPQTQILPAGKSLTSNTNSEDGFWIAVMPFKYRGANIELKDLADGLSEEIITGLSRFTYLRVIGRGSTLGLARDTGEAEAIGKELGARYVLEGSLRQVGTTIRIAAQLVETTTGAHLWAATYDREFDSERIFELQDELVPRIISTIADWYGVLAQSMSEFIRLKSPDKLSPYEALLRSFGYTARLTAEDHFETRDSLEQAVDQAPGNSDCWAMLSTIYADEYKFGFNLKPDPLSRTLAAALRAVEAAPANSFANYALAQARFLRKEFDSFRSAAERSIALNPMNGSVAAYMGQLIYHSGDRERGFELSEKARQMNPNHPGWYWIVPFHQAYESHNYRLALSYVLKVNMPALFIYHMHLTATYGQLGESHAAAQSARDLLAIVPNFELIVRDFCEKFEDPETVEHLIEGLRKAGLKIAAAPDQKELKSQILESQTIAEAESVQVATLIEAKTLTLRTFDTTSEPSGTNLERKPNTQATDPQSEIRNPKSKWWLFGLLGLIILVGGFFAYKYLKPASKQINSIAVLPFENKSSDSDTDYLSDGLAESLIYRLSQLPDLKVSPTSSVFRYKGKQTDPQVVAKELGVDSVMTGRITQRGDNLNISVNLVDTRNNKSLWGEQYERKLSELLGTQREIATEITNKLQLQLSGQGEKALAKQYTINPEAYQLYLKGNYYRSKYSDEGYKKAIDYYQQAIKIDPNYALAHTGIANSYLSVAEVYFPMSEGMPKAKTAVLTALKIDNSLAEAHALLGAISIWYDWDWAAGERELKRAIELDPNNAESHHQYGWYFAMTGKLDQAIAEGELAHRLAPLDINISGDLGGFYYFSGRNDDALRQSQKTIEIDSNSGIGYNGLGVAYAAKRQFPEAVAAMEKAHSLDDSPWLSGFRGYVYATAGKKIEAQKVLDELGELSKRRYVPAYNVAFIYAGLNDKDKAFELLNKGFQTHSGLSVIKVETALSSLRDDPRFKDLLKRMNLPE